MHIKAVAYGAGIDEATQQGVELCALLGSVLQAPGRINAFWNFTVYVEGAGIPRDGKLALSFEGNGRTFVVNADTDVKRFLEAVRASQEGDTIGPCDD